LGFRKRPVPTSESGDLNEKTQQFLMILTQSCRLHDENNIYWTCHLGGIPVYPIFRQTHIYHWLNIMVFHGCHGSNMKSHCCGLHLQFWDFLNLGSSGVQLFWLNDVHHSEVWKTMDWFKGKSTGNHHT
jgi:hypothetical protein